MGCVLIVVTNLFSLALKVGVGHEGLLHVEKETFSIQDQEGEKRCFRYNGAVFGSGKCILEHKEEKGAQ